MLLAEGHTETSRRQRGNTDPSTLNDYFLYRVEGQGVREMERWSGKSASTHLRRIRRIEEKCVENPEYAEIIDIAAEYWVETGRPEVTEDFLAVAVEKKRLAPEDADVGRIVMSEIIVDSATIIVGDMPRAALMHGNRLALSFDRSVLLHLFARGDVYATAGSTEKLRRYKSTYMLGRSGGSLPESPEQFPWHRYSRDRVNTLMKHRGGPILGNADIVLARNLRSLFIRSRDFKNKESFLAETEIERVLIPSAGEESAVMMRVLEGYLYHGEGFEHLEKRLNLPSRSAKVVLKIALDQIRYRAGEMAANTRKMLEI